mgnify:CR=1 FL=1|tara:strand:+ start:3737 stop:3952 length:216 start_codon:yes stop_codon:yes gene_type:complete
MVANSKIKDVKLVRIQTEGIELKWNVFCVYAKSIGTTPRKLLGKILKEYWVRNLTEITHAWQNAMGIDEEE